MMMLTLSRINRFTLLLHHQIRNNQLLLRLQDHNLAFLPRGQGINHRFILLLDSELFHIVGVGKKLDEKFINSLGV